MLLCVLQTSSGETRARMGEVAHQRSEFVIVTNSSPRLEEPADIVQVSNANRARYDVTRCGVVRCALGVGGMAYNSRMGMRAKCC